VLKPSLLALPCVSREHTQGVIVKCRGEVAWLGGYQGYCARRDTADQKMGIIGRQKEGSL
jgi:hypothetical protein